MKLIRTRPLLLAATIACFSLSASATIILDGYEGASSVKSNGTSYGDVIGSTSNFQINYMDASFDNNTSILSVTIDTTFGGKADNGLFSGYTNTALSAGRGIGYGDLFLSSTWTPFNGLADAPYVSDDASNGTVWSHGFSLDDRWGAEGSTHKGILYSLNSADNDADAYLSDDFLSSSTFTYRNGQEVAVDTDNGDVTAISNGTWTTSENKISFEVDLTGSSLLDGTSIALHWGMTCANDMIEGLYTRKVPEPSLLALLAIGFSGIGLVRYKKT